MSPTSGSSGGHSRSLSLGSGSVGAAEAHRLLAQTELGRYIEEDDEDYEDIFAAPADLCTIELYYPAVVLSDTNITSDSYIIAREVPKAQHQTIE